MTVHDFRGRAHGHGLSGWLRINSTTAETYGHGAGVELGDLILMDWTRAGAGPAVVMTVAGVEYLSNPRLMFRAVLRDPHVPKPDVLVTARLETEPPLPPRWLLPPSAMGVPETGGGAANPSPKGGDNPGTTGKGCRLDC